MRLSLFVAAAMLCTSLAAHADSLTNTFTFAPLSGYSSESGTSFAQFDPTLGTLNSVTLNFKRTVTFSGGGDSDVNDAEARLRLGSDFEETDALTLGNGPGTFPLGNYTYTRANAA